MMAKFRIETIIQDAASEASWKYMIIGKNAYQFLYESYDVWVFKIHPGNVRETVHHWQNEAGVKAAEAESKRRINAPPLGGTNGV